MIKFTAEGGKTVVVPFWSMLSIEEAMSDEGLVVEITLLNGTAYTTKDSFVSITEQYEKVFRTGFRFHGEVW